MATNSKMSTATATTAFASHLKQSKKCLQNLAKTMKWPPFKEKFTATFENRVTLANVTPSYCEITITDTGVPAPDEGEKDMVVFMQFRVTGDIDDDNKNDNDNEFVSQGFWKKLLRDPKQLMARN